LFERLQQAGRRVYMLETQYRMHPHIRAFPSAQFYRDQLKDGDNVTGPGYVAPFHSHPRFPPFQFFDLRSQHTRMSSKSIMNAQEAKFVVELIGDFLKTSPDFPLNQIAVITFYAQQRRYLQRLIDDVFPSAATKAARERDAASKSSDSKGAARMTI
jgi:senataxin